MAHDNQIRLNLPSEVPNFFGGLTSYKFCHGAETELPKPGDALVKYVHVVVFRMNGCSSEAHLSQQQCTGINNHR